MHGLLRTLRRWWNIRASKRRTYSAHDAAMIRMNARSRL